MWENFRNWYKSNDQEITWFLIGFLMSSGINSVASHDYVNAVICFLVAGANYKFRNIKA